MLKSKALVLFSGGQDSTVCLAWALERFDGVETLGFDYGQRHRIELAQRRSVLAGLRQLSLTWSQRLGQDHILNLPELSVISDTALTRDKAIEFDASGLPSTFVPGRNFIFLSYAAVLAYRRGIAVLVGGMCEADYSGYPDCRSETMAALQEALSLGLAQQVKIETPLMWIDKAGTWAMADELGGKALVDLIVSDTHTCYLGDHQARHAWGYGCGECPACHLRAKGWEKWQEERRL